MSESRPGDARDGQWIPLLLAWIIVGVPTVWGVTQTVIKSLALFSNSK